MAMSFMDMTMPLEVIKKWVKRMDPYLEYKNKARTQFSQFMRQEINQKRVNHNKELMGPPQIPIVKIIEQLADIKNVTEQDSMNLKT